jgi:hypothetical protein
MMRNWSAANKFEVLMSLVDRYTAAEMAVRASAAHLSSPDNRQGWLKALESAGLQEALQNTHAFAPTGSFEPHVQSSDDSSNSPVAVTQLADQEVQNHGRAASALLPLQRFTAQVESLVANHVECKGRQTAVAWSESQRQVVELTGLGVNGQEVDAPHPTSDGTTQAQKFWHTRNLLLLPVEAGGVEVWVRDAKLSAARMQMLISDLRRASTELGSGPVKVFLNGQPVSSASGHTQQGE